MPKYANEPPVAGHLYHAQRSSIMDKNLKGRECKKVRPGLAALKKP
jgi:hypothetical protein